MRKFTTFMTQKKTKTQPKTKSLPIFLTTRIAGCCASDREYFNHVNLTEAWLRKSEMNVRKIETTRIETIRYTRPATENKEKTSGARCLN